MDYFRFANIHFNCKIVSQFYMKQCETAPYMQISSFFEHFDFKCFLNKDSDLNVFKKR